MLVVLVHCMRCSENMEVRGSINPLEAFFCFNRLVDWQSFSETGHSIRIFGPLYKFDTTL